MRRLSSWKNCLRRVKRTRMSEKCKAAGGVIENDEIRFGVGQQSGELYYILTRQKLVLTTKEFNDCDFGGGVKIVMNYSLETPKLGKPVPSFKLGKPIPTLVTQDTFKPDLSSLSIEFVKPLPQLEKVKLQVEEEPNPFFTPADLMIGGVSSLVMVMAVVQTINQKRKEAESAKCCSDNKLSISNIDAKVTKLEAELKAKAEESNKSLHAEIYEQYREMREIREDAQEVKDILSKVIDKIKS